MRPQSHEHRAGNGPFLQEGVHAVHWQLQRAWRKVRTVEENHNFIDKYNDNDNDNIVRYTLAKLSDKEKKAGVIAASAGNHAQVSLNKVSENVS